MVIFLWAKGIPYLNKQWKMPSLFRQEQVNKVRVMEKRNEEVVEIIL